MIKYSFKLLLCALLAGSFATASELLEKEERRVIERPELDFKELNTEQLHFPKDFLFGFAIAEQQNSGADHLPDSQWTRWEQTEWPDGTPHINKGMTSGKANNHWELFEEDAKLMKQDFNANAFRFSLAWDRIEPKEGEFNDEALQHYSDEVDALLKQGIQPMITLHHFAHPNWFEDKGGFEKEENVEYFVRYSKKVFELLGDRVTYWCTINEPTIYVFQGYLPFNCVFPPGKARGLNKLTSWQLAVKVLCNLMQGHAEVYNALKKMKHGDKAQIGLVHQYLLFESYSSFDPIEKFPGFMLNNFMVDSVIDFLKTGTFDYGIPGITRQVYKAPEGPLGDFVGLNYYSRVRLKFDLFAWPPKIDSAVGKDEIMTDMPFGIYAQGIYKALHHMAEIGLPIYITENGIADDKDTDDFRRVKWVKEYLKAISLAIEDGIDVRGYFYWTLIDNFEWDMGWHCKFGMYNKARELKDGAKIYAEIINKTRNGELEEYTDDYIYDKEAFKKELAKLSTGSVFRPSLTKLAITMGVAYLAYKYFTGDGVEETI